MIIARPPNPTLASVEAALAFLLEGLKPVAAVEEALATALGGIAAGTEPLASPLPAVDQAAADGFAFQARDLAGASSYSPVTPALPPAWVEAGEAMPEGSDCVLDAALVDATGRFVQVLAEAIPGEGVRRIGEDFSVGSIPVEAGRQISFLDVLIARRAGFGSLSIRRPRLRIVNAGAAGESVTTEFIVESAKAAGAKLAGVETMARDATSIGAALAGDCDLIIIVGGTGGGRDDNTAAALAACGVQTVHGIALHPGRTAAAGRLGDIPVIALPGAPDQAIGPWLTLVRPVLDRLSGRQARRTVVRPLARKISSAIGITELVLLLREGEAWMPLAIGALSLHHLGEAEAWLSVPGDSEGYAPGTPVAGFPLRGMA